MAEIILTRDLGRAGRGVTEALTMADDAGARYFVKLIQNPMYPSVLAYEYVSGKIAEYLGLPTPKIFIAEIAAPLVPSLGSKYGIAINAGPHFASAAVANIYGLPVIRSLIAKCVNTSSFPGIILFDALVFNQDRNNDGNFLFTTDNNEIALSIIDHGHCFGALQNAHNLMNYKDDWSRSYLPEMYELITDEAAFAEALVRFERLDSDFFATLVSRIPDEWTDLDSRERMLEFLNYRRDHLREMLVRNKNLFINWP
ncbi:MAG: hypothetical protein EOO09_13175 [Chitinophagaceae bacterium]|nr:MAG: hypothetical protein EOO09_13175 [Chitinophagaceae bacterium]